MKKIHLLAAALAALLASPAGCAVGETSIAPGSTGGGETGGGVRAGAPCDNDAACGAQAFCRIVETSCSTPRTVTLSAGTCVPRTSSCTSSDQCPHDAACEGGVCKSFPDTCNVAPAMCPAGCAWTDPWPCACVCPACP